MSKRYNKAFLADPLKFSRGHSLIVESGGDQVLKDKTSYLSVPSNRRVWYWNIKEEAEATPKHRGLCMIDLVAKPKKDYLPCFWLPWKAGSIIKCTLKAKKTHEDDEVQVFFTAPVDGCSILIEGPRDNPSVYHANANDYTAGNDLYTQRQNRTAKIEQRWRNVPLPKRAIAEHLQTKTTYRNQFTGRALHGHHYMKDYLQPTKEPDQLLKKSKIKGQVFQRKYMGTVFGLRDPESGYWSFFYQRLFYIYYMGSSNQGVKQWFRSGANKFWPGNGTLVLHKRSPVYNVDPELGIEMM